MKRFAAMAILVAIAKKFRIKLWNKITYEGKLMVTRHLRIWEFFGSLVGSGRVWTGLVGSGRVWSVGVGDFPVLETLKNHKLVGKRYFKKNCTGYLRKMELGPKTRAFGYCEEIKLQ